MQSYSGHTVKRVASIYRSLERLQALARINQSINETGSDTMRTKLESPAETVLDPLTCKYLERFPDAWILHTMSGNAQDASGTWQAGKVIDTYLVKSKRAYNLLARSLWDDGIVKVIAGQRLASAQESERLAGKYYPYC
jgi:hypothetical protein